MDLVVAVVEPVVRLLVLQVDLDLPTQILQDL
jgi:hypothetical protein